MPTTIIEKYVTAATDHGKYTKSGNSRACNQAHDRVMRALREIRKLPDRGEGILLDLVGHTDESVRTWAGTHLLPLREEVACRVLENVAAGSGLIAFDAEMVLKEWRAGRLRVE